jgi:hypothetical protein
MAASKNIDELLHLLVGQYAWLVQRGYGTMLKMQFGQPHRVVRKPIRASDDASTTVKKTLARRVVLIEGDISLRIRDSRWSISTEDVVVDWRSDASAVDNMLVFHLDGQRVLSADRRVDETVLKFDLGTTLRLGRSIYPGDMESGLWSISMWEGPRAVLFDGGRAEYRDGDGGHTK